MSLVPGAFAPAARLGLPPPEIVAQGRRKPLGALVFRTAAAAWDVAAAGSSARFPLCGAKDNPCNKKPGRPAAPRLLGSKDGLRNTGAHTGARQPPVMLRPRREPLPQGAGAPARGAALAQEAPLWHKPPVRAPALEAPDDAAVAQW